LGELKARLDMDDLPGEARGRYNTLAGLLMSITGRLPRLGERIACQHWEFEVFDLDGRRVDKVLAVLHNKPDAAA
jgi:putative hemolysin